MGTSNNLDQYYSESTTYKTPQEKIPLGGLSSYTEAKDTNKWALKAAAAIVGTMALKNQATKILVSAATALLLYLGTWVTWEHKNNNPIPEKDYAELWLDGYKDKRERLKAEKDTCWCKPLDAEESEMVDKIKRLSVSDEYKETARAILKNSDLGEKVKLLELSPQLTDSVKFYHKNNDEFECLSEVWVVWKTKLDANSRKQDWEKVTENLNYPKLSISYPGMKYVDLSAVATTPSRRVLNNIIQNFPWELLALSSLEKLIIRDSELSNIPKSIEKLENLESLDFYENLITTLPKELWKLKNLKSLQLWKNYIAKLPDEITDLENLEYLFLPSNKIESIPEQCWKLTNLKAINLSENKLKWLPNSICSLINLEKLCLDENETLTGLPFSIWKLSKLEYLNADNNKITELPESICELGSLKSLDLSKNNLSNLPDSIGKLKQLGFIHLSENNIGTLPESIINLEKIRYLYIKNCPLTIETKQKLVVAFWGKVKFSD